MTQTQCLDYTSCLLPACLATFSEPESRSLTGGEGGGGIRARQSLILEDTARARAHLRACVLACPLNTNIHSLTHSRPDQPSPAQPDHSLTHTHSPTHSPLTHSLFARRVAKRRARSIVSCVTYVHRSYSHKAFLFSVVRHYRLIVRLVAS